MTYGVYSRDLHSMSISNMLSIAECKAYIWDDDEYVVCSEKGVGCSIIMHGRDMAAGIMPRMRKLK